MSGARFEATITANDMASAKIAVMSSHIEILTKKMKAMGGLVAMEKPGTSMEDIAAVSAKIRGMTFDLEKMKHVGGEVERYTWKEAAEFVHRFDEHIDQGTEKVRHFAGRIAAIMTPLAGLGALGELGGGFELAAKATDHFFMLEKQAKIVGMSSTEWQKYQFIAKMTDTDIGKMTIGFQRMNANIGAAAMGNMPVLKKALGELGISLKDGSGHLKTMDQLLPDMFKAFQKNPNRFKQGELSRLLFGRSGLDLETMFNLTKEQFDELSKTFFKLTYLPPAGAKLDLSKYHDSWIEMGTAVDSLIYQMGIQLAPILRPIVDDFTNFLSEHHVEIATRLTSSVRGIATWLKEVDWTRWGQDMVTAGGDAGWLFDELGGVKTMLITVGSYKLVEWTAAVISNFAKIVKAARETTLFLKGLGLLLATPGGVIGAGVAATAGLAIGLSYEGEDAESRVGKKGLQLLYQQQLQQTAGEYGTIPDYSSTADPLHLFTPHPTPKLDAGPRPAPIAHVVVKFQNTPAGTTTTITREDGVLVRTKNDGEVGHGMYQP